MLVFFARPLLFACCYRGCRAFFVAHSSRVGIPAVEYFSRLRGVDRPIRAGGQHSCSPAGHHRPPRPERTLGDCRVVFTGVAVCRRVRHRFLLSGGGGAGHFDGRLPRPAARWAWAATTRSLPSSRARCATRARRPVPCPRSKPRAVAAGVFRPCPLTLPPPTARSHRRKVANVIQEE